MRSLLGEETIGSKSIQAGMVLSFNFNTHKPIPGNVVLTALDPLLGKGDP